MSHQVLARKWRPRNFESLVGQEHVVRALSHALGSGRLHHAYLFTGTRGVGKTTIARILAKSLNCEVGVSAKPCGVCRACTEIDGGRFVDYIEMDAASNRGVDEMTQVLENAVYAPTAARYKVYVIDEVHMLSIHAFNAMLKTLEEPPPHVIFVLATTDPQKVPVTVLSRCLQFNLKNMTPQAIAGHLAYVLGAETIAFEPDALPHIGRAAGGSMRDALSLLDQAIAYGGGAVTESAVREMLGVVDSRDLTRLLDGLLAGDGKALVALADEMLAGNAPFERTLQDFAALLQRVALAQVGVIADEARAEMLSRYAGQMAAEDLQVYYQIALHGARDLPLAIDPLSGFTMVLLRLLAFRPEEGGAGTTSTAGGAALSRAGTGSPPPGSNAPANPGAQSPAMSARAAAIAAASLAAAGARAGPRPAPMIGKPGPTSAASDAARSSVSAPDLAAADPMAVATVTESEPKSELESTGALPAFDGDWPALGATLSVTGLTQQLLRQSELIEFAGQDFRLRVPIKALAEPGTVAKLREALTAHFGTAVRLTVDVGGVVGKTAAAVATQQQADRMSQAREAIDADPFVQSLIADFDAKLVPDSIRPIDPPDRAPERRS